MQQVDRVFLQGLVINPGVGNVQIEDGGDQVEQPHHHEGHFGDRVHRGVDHGHVEGQQALGDFRLDQEPAENRAENDCADGEAFDPTIGDHQQAVGQVFGEDAVFGGGICRST